MKLIKIFLKYLNLKSKKLKTLQFSDTDNNLKFSKGDFVKIFPESDGIWSVSFTGKIIDYGSGLKEPVYIVETYSSNLRFPESALKHNNPDDERDWKLKQLLK
jgi:hypothetical protein